MTRYLKNDYGNTRKTGGTTTYVAVGPERPAEGSSDAYFPAAQLDVVNTPETDIVHFSNSPNLEDWDEVGLSPTYLGYLHNQRHPEAVDYLNKKADHGMVARQTKSLVERGLEVPKEHAARELKAKQEREEALRKFKATPEGTPNTLFTTIPSKNVIHGMYADPSMRAHVLTLGAMAHQDFGGVLEADSSLSESSAPLARKAVSRGLPIRPSTENPTMKTTNGIRMKRFPVQTISDYSRTADDLVNRGFTEMPPERVASAKAHLKTVLRGETPTAVPLNTPRYRKPMLPGLEW